MHKITTNEIDRLDREVRKSGAVLLVIHRPKMEKYGFYNGIPVPVLINGELGHVPYILLTSEIDKEHFKKTAGSVELDRSCIPEELIFDFFVHHEIAHAIFGHPEMMRQRERFGGLYGRLDSEVVEVLKHCCEITADRYAWRKIQPGVPLPVCKREGIKKNIAKFDGFMKKNRAIFKSFHPLIRTIPVDAQVDIIGLTR